MGSFSRRSVYVDLLMILVVLVAACGGASTKEGTTAARGEEGSTTASCEPGRCLEDIGRLVKEHRAEARACYDQGPAGKPGSTSRLILNFEIDPSGTITEVSQGVQDDQITDPPTIQCVSDVLKKITFPRSAKGKTTRAYHHFQFMSR